MRTENRMNGVEARVTKLIEPLAESLGLELVRVRFKGSVLQIMAERPDGTMRIEDCTRLSKTIEPALDEADPISENYSLEVSSPGIDRPLTRPKDFTNWAGHETKVEMRIPANGRKRFRGVLKGLEGEDAVLELKNKDGSEETVRLPIADISEAKLVLTKELLKQAQPVNEAEFDEIEEEGVGTRD
jgi:ribosome maturation factor RimP